MFFVKLITIYDKYHPKVMTFMSTPNWYLLLSLDVTSIGRGSHEQREDETTA
ncbi:hypothetical protein J6TS1_32900 [Siminovitchia terrae]|uniref:Uncharacterized protein n=1 Tax=Siminovitchia terrae TaxID=1914933 RepID=A0ABQ4KZG4_SIMTE|nr:hypothetical protein J6TS1_32900 [Siminovitchia terrae]